MQRGQVTSLLGSKAWFEPPSAFLPGWRGGLAIRRPQTMALCPAGGRAPGRAAHPYAVTDSPSRPFQAAEGILTGCWHLHSQLAARDTGSHCSPRFPGGGRMAQGSGRRAAAGGQTKERAQSQRRRAGRP